MSGLSRFLWITLLIPLGEPRQTRAQQGFQRFAAKKGMLSFLYESMT
jgi:hypothetical protein